eukprot:TRINITY_DN2669_c0_g1_i10.p1 TRINITY_DN2669_c0_g1~~TRINITY_DN2669_c0_g1_i10.p1  ORF type:complete len:130 (-),score=25.24 TRINITY_DN2669_c0_g1_i10:350-739(-)
MGLLVEERFTTKLRTLNIQISFPPGKIYKFFECFYKVTHLNLLGIIGVSCEIGGPYPDEDELCCGTCEPEVMLVAIAKFTGILEDDKEAKVVVKATGLDYGWFRDTVTSLKCACEVAIASGGVLVVLVE